MTIFFTIPYLLGGGSRGKLPINQRGLTSYVNTNNVIDRWKIIGSIGDQTSFTISSDFVTYSDNVGTSLNQYIDNYDQLLNQTVTLSILYRTVSEGFTMIVRGGEGSGNVTDFATQPLPVSESWNLISVTAQIPSEINQIFRIVLNHPTSLQASIDIKAMKLELGDNQTLAYQDDNSNWKLYSYNDYVTELNKCLYYQKATYISQTPSICDNDNQLQILLSDSSLMRITTPSFQIKSDCCAHNCSNGTVIDLGSPDTSININFFGSCITIKNSNFTPGTTYIVNTSNVSNNYVSNLTSIFVDANP